MLSKNQIKFVRSLHQAKYRRQNGLFLAEGPRIVGELISSSFGIHSIFAVEEWISSQGTNLPSASELIPVSQGELERISTLQAPNGVIALMHMKDREFETMEDVDDLFLALDGIRDPGNLGTIIRTADWFGITTIFCSQDCVDVYNPKVVQATMGSIARVDVVYSDLAELFQSVKGICPVYGAMLEGKNMYDQELSPKGFLLIGSESHGISHSLLPYITRPLRIPGYGSEQGQAESLNASIATAVLCAEFRRQYK